MLSTIQLVQATIVGAGVSGLTVAAVFLEAGWEVTVVARETHESTVSVVAAAIWTVTDAVPREAARRWALTSRERFAALAEETGTGVVPMRQRELERVDPGPTWWETQPFVRRLGTDELPAGFAAGLEIDGFMIEPPIYLSWLTDRISKLGAEVTIAEVERLDHVDGDVVVNCSGLGASALAGDDSLYPIRGQVVAVANPGIRDGVADESDPERIAYVYPRSKEVVLGGSRLAGSSTTFADQASTERILTDCARLDPRVAQLEPIEVRVGLRPGRPSVRVEADRDANGRPIVHNYGHGGAGYILSWGAALEALDLAVVATQDVVGGR
jgi:D-amino-acid oxidase